FMFNSSQTLRVIFSVVMMALLVVSTALAQEKPSGALNLLDVVAPSILKQNLVSVPKEPGDAVGAQDSLLDFTRPRLTNPEGLIPAPDGGIGLKERGDSRTVSVPLRITLEEAQARAATFQTLILAGASVDAARYHRQAAQADYFPKVGAYLVNLHYNKFMGDTIQLFRRGVIIPTVSRAVPLFDKDQTFVGPTVTQPLTPLFKIHEAVRISKADERIARAKANAASFQLTADVERAFFD